MTWGPDVYLIDSATTTDTVTGATWTAHGSTLELLYSAETIRAELANALGTLLAPFEVTVSPYAPNHIDPPHIFLEADDPFMEPATQGRGGPNILTWAYMVQVVISAKKHQATADWFERLAPYIIDACYEVPGARFEQFDAPDETEAGDSRYLVASGHVTVKRER